MHALCVNRYNNGKNVLVYFQFSAWLGETESMFESIEQEIERNPLALKVGTT